LDAILRFCIQMIFSKNLNWLLTITHSTCDNWRANVTAIQCLISAISATRLITAQSNHYPKYKHYLRPSIEMNGPIWKASQHRDVWELAKARFHYDLLRYGITGFGKVQTQKDLTNLSNSLTRNAATFLTHKSLIIMCVCVAGWEYEWSKSSYR
jgi:hypothetical protein